MPSFAFARPLGLAGRAFAECLLELLTAVALKEKMDLFLPAALADVGSFCAFVEGGRAISQLPASGPGSSRDVSSATIVCALFCIGAAPPAGRLEGAEQLRIEGLRWVFSASAAAVDSDCVADMPLHPACGLGVHGPFAAGQVEGMFPTLEMPRLRGPRRCCGTVIGVAGTSAEDELPSTIAGVSGKARLASKATF
eukprot:5844374-Pleurochrysis_carterae.AAC.3